MKKILNILVIVLIFTTQNSVIVLAQESLSSAQSVSSDSAQTQPAQTPPISPTPYQLDNDRGLDGNIPSSIPTPTQPAEPSTPPTSLPRPKKPDVSPFGKTETLSAKIKKPTQVLPLQKKIFQANENIEVEVINTYNEAVTVSVEDASGDELPVVVEEQQDGENTLVQIRQPASFKPGRYKLKITDSLGNSTEQDFTWGVLAINTNKSIYTLKDKQAQLAMAVLDQNGNMVCNAKVKLKITDPANREEELTTDNGSIIINPGCSKKEVSLTPDYAAVYKINGLIGQYQIQLTAQTNNGVYTITDYFEVRESVPFDVERITATRIYPKSPYPVTLKILANQDFSGTIVETVPDGFIISPPGEGAKTYDKVKVVPFGIYENDATASASLDIGYPFFGRYNLTSRFGTEELDPLLKKNYEYYGVIGHDGVDYDVPQRTEVLAVDNGMVEFVGDKPYGNTLVLRHAWGQSYYGHLSKVDVDIGQSVLKSEKIALSGNTGLSTGPHLHFGIKLNKNDPGNGYFGKIDPLPFLNSKTLLSDYMLQQIIWSIDLKKGETINLGYNYDAPDQSPQFYLAGPLKFTKQLPPNIEISESVATSSGIINESNSGVNNSSDSAKIRLNQSLNSYPSTDKYYLTAQTIFQEARKWQIAVDAPLTITLQEQDECTIDPGGTCVDDVSHNSVVTATNTTAVYNQLYLAAVSTKPSKSIDSVTGLGLAWTNIRSQCGHRGQTNTAVFYAIGSPTADGTVTANLNGGTNFTGSSVISVFRYSGVDAQDPIGNIVSANYDNTAGSVDLYDTVDNTVCNGAESAATDIDNFSYAALDTSQTESLVFVAAGQRRRTLTAGTGYTLQENTNSAYLANSAGVGVEDQIFSAVTTNLTVSGTFSAAVDWGVVSVEILADRDTPDNIMRHGKWFSDEGARQPFTF